MNEGLIFLKQNLKDACLESFGIKRQFLELEFSSEQFEKIIFFLDCKISTNDLSVVDKVEQLKIFCEDTYGIGYLIPANLKMVRASNLDKHMFNLSFMEGYNLFFDLNSSQEPLSISFYKKINDKIYDTVHFTYGGEIEFYPKKN